jgi:hypothetical protein
MGKRAGGNGILSVCFHRYSGRSRKGQECEEEEKVRGKQKRPRERGKGAIHLSAVVGKTLAPLFDYGLFVAVMEQSSSAPRIGRR